MLSPPPDFGKKHDQLLFRAQLYFAGEVEAVFGFLFIPLFVAIIGFLEGAADGCQGKKSAQLS
jgi:hypothetical protein